MPQDDDQADEAVPPSDDESSDWEPAPLPVCDGQVGLEKLRECIGIGTETPTLDFKRTADLTKRADVLEMAKDIAAMRSNRRGGYLVYGFDDRGRLPAAGEVAALDPRHFDDAFIRPKLRSYLGEDLQIRVCIHELDEATVAVLYAAPSPEGIHIHPMLADGTYNAERAGDPPLFRRGEVFVRRGTSVDRWQPSDLPRLIAPALARVRDEERRVALEQQASFRSSMAGAGIARGPVGGLTWHLPMAEFGTAVLEAVRAGDDVVIRAALLPLTDEVRHLSAEAGTAADVVAVLDRVAAVLAIGITYDKPRPRAEALGTLHRIYDLGYDATGQPRGALAFGAPQLWREVAMRLEALGGLAVRLEQWDVIAEIVDYPAEDNWHRTWLRHAVTMAARASLWQGGSGDNVGALAGAARELADSVPALRPDALRAPAYAQGAAPAEDDPVLDSILQFDLVWCLWAAVQGPHGDGEFYPSFATYYGWRVMPFADRLVDDAALRQQVLGNLSDQQLADALRSVLGMARREAMGHNMWQLDFRSPRVDQFINDHPQSGVV